MVDILADEYPMTVRQMFYRLVSAGLVDKTEGEYKRTVARLLGQMRLRGEIPFGWIADGTRWMRKPESYGSVEAALRRTAAGYRRALWAEQDSHVEVWLEKDALAGVLFDVTAEFDVPLMVTRGYPSLTFLYDGAAVIAAKQKPAWIYYLGDLDPSGVDISRNVEARLREFAPKARIMFDRIAVSPYQIDLYKLATRPTKATDSRSQRFRGESVEVDAIPPATLRELVRGAIEAHIRPGSLDALRVAEESERSVLTRIAESMS